MSKKVTVTCTEWTATDDNQLGDHRTDLDRDGQDQLLPRLSRACVLQGEHPLRDRALPPCAVPGATFPLKRHPRHRLRTPSRAALLQAGRQQIQDTLRRL